MESAMQDDQSDDLLGVKKAAPHLIQTALQPAAEELGKGIVTVARAVNVALSPVEGVVWGFEKIRDYVTDYLQHKFEGIDPAKIVPPNPHVAGPALEALRFTGHQDELRSLFSELLKTSMHSDYAHIAHPAFVQIISQLCSDEAKLVKEFPKKESFPFLCEAIYEDNDIHDMYTNLYPEFKGIAKKAGLSHPELSESYFDNLRRLNLLEVRNSPDEELVEKGIGHTIRGYDDSPYYDLERSRYEAVYVTHFGRQFIKACTDFG
jgi:hypothetical protein